MAYLRNSATASTLRGTVPGRGVPDPGTLEDRRFELWLRRGTGTWRTEGEASHGALTLKAKKFIETLEAQGRAGQATIRRVGEFPSHLDEGEYKTKTWAQAMLDDANAH